MEALDKGLSLMKRALALLAIFFTLLLTGCANPIKPPEPTNAQADTQIVIGYTSGYINNPFCQEFLSYAREECEREGIGLVALDGNNDVARQTSIIQQWTRGGVDAVICSPVNPVSIQASLDTLMDAGIPVINIDSECQNSTVYVGFDQFEYGYMAGKIAADWINKNLSDMTRVPCAVLTKPQSLSLIERENGIMSALTEHCSKAVIIGTPVYSDQASAYEATKELLKQNPEVCCIVGVADVSILGAYDALVDMGLDTDEMCLVGLDATREILRLMGEGSAIRGTASLNTEMYAKTAIDAALRAIRGEEVESRIIIKITPVTIENLQDFYPLESQGEGQ